MNTGMEELLEYLRKSIVQSEERYNTLVSIILNSLEKCSYKDSGVQIKSDSTIIGYLQAVEPEKYNKIVSALNKKSEAEQHIPNIE